MWLLSAHRVRLDTSLKQAVRYADALGDESEDRRRTRQFMIDYFAEVKGLPCSTMDSMAVAVDRLATGMQDAVQVIHDRQVARKLTTGDIAYDNPSCLTIEGIRSVTFQTEYGPIGLFAEAISRAGIVNEFVPKARADAACFLPVPSRTWATLSRDGILAKESFSDAAIASGYENIPPGLAMRFLGERASGVSCSADVAQALEAATALEKRGGNFLDMPVLMDLPKNPSRDPNIDHQRKGMVLAAFLAS